MRDVVFVLLPDIVLLDLAGPADAFRVAAKIVPGSYRLQFVADNSSASAAGGLTFSGLRPLPARLAGGSIVVLMGTSSSGGNADDPATQRLIAWLRTHAGSGTLM